MKFTGTNPIYIQIADYIKKLIETGVYKNGDSLPSVRDFAMANGVNPNTVARAYEVLIQSNVIVSIPKKGYFVKEEETQSENETSKLEKMVDAILADGYSKEDILEVLERKSK